VADHVNFVFRFQLFEPAFMFIFVTVFKVHAFMFKNVKIKFAEEEKRRGGLQRKGREEKRR